MGFAILEATGKEPHPYPSACKQRWLIYSAWQALQLITLPNRYQI
jgi:hypothetical protein